MVNRALNKKELLWGNQVMDGVGRKATSEIETALKEIDPLSERYAGILIDPSETQRSSRIIIPPHSSLTFEYSDGTNFLEYYDRIILETKKIAEKYGLAFIEGTYTTCGYPIRRADKPRYQARIEKVTSLINVGIRGFKPREFHTQYVIEPDYDAR